jgi:hypothetical protein
MWWHTWKNQISSFGETSPFKLAGASVQSTTGSQGVCISGSNAGYTMFWGSVKSTGYPRHSPVSLHFPFRASPCAITFQLDPNSDQSELQKGERDRVSSKNGSFKGSSWTFARGPTLPRWTLMSEEQDFLLRGVKTQWILEITPLGTMGTNTEGMLRDQHNIYLTLSPFLSLIMTWGVGFSSFWQLPCLESDWNKEVATQEIK